VKIINITVIDWLEEDIGKVAVGRRVTACRKCGGYIISLL
jgi:hypothetical protein